MPDGDNFFVVKTWKRHVEKQQERVTMEKSSFTEYLTHEERIKWATGTRLGAIWICCVQAQTANSNSAAETFLMCLRQNKGPAWVGAHDWEEK